MFKLRRGLLLLVVVSALAAIALSLYFSGSTSTEQVQSALQQAGYWAPLIYIAIYVVATVLILPSTALNLAGGAVFGPWAGTFWTSVAAIVAAIVTFWFTRTVGHSQIKRRLPPTWAALDSELNQAGIAYMFAIRLLPIIPYGVVNFAAGLTSISFRDYTLGTLLGTVPGVFPFVLLGSSGLKALKTGQVLPLVLPLVLIGLLVLAATWHQRHQRKSKPKG